MAHYTWIQIYHRIEPDKESKDFKLQGNMTKSPGQMKSQKGDLTCLRSHNLELKLPNSVHWLKGVRGMADTILLRHSIVSDFL